jgi:hypothetical protein
MPWKLGSLCLNPLLRQNPPGPPSGHSRTSPARQPHEVPYSEPPLPTFRPSDEDEALL